MSVWLSLWVAAQLLKTVPPRPQPLISVFLPALLTSQVVLHPVKLEEKPLPPPVTQQDTEAEKQLIREVRPGAGGGGATGDNLQNDGIPPLGLVLQSPLWSSRS